MRKVMRQDDVRIGFEMAGRWIGFDDIQPLRLVPGHVRKSRKYAQIAASIGEVGIIEPPVVARDRAVAGRFLLLDGHLRIQILKDMGGTGAVCMISTDDEAFTYNKRVSRLAIIQEHKMILKAIEQGVPEERIARALKINIKTLQDKKTLLDGICPEVVDILKDKHLSIGAFRALRKMRSYRQIEAAELMATMNNYTESYARSLLAATSSSQLVEGGGDKKVKGLTLEQMALMERESANLDSDIKSAQLTYGPDHLDLVPIKGYLGRLLGNACVVRYLSLHHTELLAEFLKIADIENGAGA